VALPPICGVAPELPDTPQHMDQIIKVDRLVTYALMPSS
jgi:hypothetical protein